MAEPLVRTIKAPNKSNTRITGSNQNFFLTFMNDHKSFKNSITRIFIKKVFQNQTVRTDGFLHA